VSRFATVLVANRGEIACRIIRAARALGYETVAVYSEPDADALHVRLADRAAALGGAAAAESYLSIDRVLAAARRAGADAVHPGYGFLSENDRFAAACAAAGLVFIGPPAEAIRLMGNKAAAKQHMREAGVPVIPGSPGADQDEAALARAAGEVGYPLLVKAAAGGGGRGMRLVRAPDELAPALGAARREAESAFGDGALLLERALVDARHVEIQVFADQHGQVVHLGERDCSIQRRYQKVIEETPSPAVDAELRARMGAAAVAAARSIGYVGAGTVEFLLDRDGRFYFLEMNTRLQVEHPVTEMVTGLDLVALQLRVAAGERLPFTQQDIDGRARGHAIEARLCAEDPHAGFLPQVGRVLRWSPGATDGEGRRIDHGLVEGQAITSWYDPLLAKLVAWGETRELARRRLARLLADTTLLGVTTNKTFLTQVLAHPVFVAGEATTAFLGAHPFDRPPAPAWLRAAAAVLLSLRATPETGFELGFRSSGDASWPVRLAEGDEAREALLTIRAAGGSRYLVTAGAETIELSVIAADVGEARVLVDGVSHRLRHLRDGDTLHVDSAGQVMTFRELTGPRAATAVAGPADGRVVAPMNGRLIAVHVAAGDAVTRGQVVAVVEAMKMECPLRAEVDGQVAEVLVKAPTQVAARQLLLQITRTTP
jgi:geranyl-CoA carboxylase alpha subunit